MVTPKAVEFVIFMCCCALLPSLTDPKLIEVGLAVTDDADAALHAKIKNNNSITAIGNAKQNFFDIVWLSVTGRGLRHCKNLPGPLDFHDGGSLRIASGERLLVWRHAQGQGEVLSPDVPAVMRS
jgi:hypothetical protein